MVFGYRHGCFAVFSELRVIHIQNQGMASSWTMPAGFLAGLVSLEDLWIMPRLGGLPEGAFEGLLALRSVSINFDSPVGRLPERTFSGLDEATAAH